MIQMPTDAGQADGLAQNTMLPAGVLFVSENENVIIGKMYDVKCAKMSNGRNSYFVPIIGEAHNDNQFGFVDKHHHIDGRFATKRNIDQLWINDFGETATVCSYKPSNAYYTIESIVVRKMKCRKTTTGLNVPNRDKLDFWGQPKAEKFWEWSDTMMGKSCKGKKCPHLGTMMVEQNGMLVCTLHNLQGCIKSEVIVSVACR